MSSPEDSICFFTDSLPAELRVRIYEMVLAFDRPLQLRSNFHSHGHLNRSRDTSLLRVSRLIYREALQVFYSLNTIAGRRSDFCRRNDTCFRLPFKPRLIRHLMVTNLDKSENCSTLHWTENSCEECKPQMPCRACEPSPWRFLIDLQLLPKLRSATVNYGGHFHDLLELRDMLKKMGRGHQLKCVGIGDYELEGERLGGVRTCLKNMPLVRDWPVLIGRNPNRSPHERRPSWVHGIFRTRLYLMLERHDNWRPPRIPYAIASIWPRDLPQDLQIASVVGPSRPAFLQAFNDTLEITLSLSDATYVARRVW